MPAESFFSVIIPTYNRANLISETIESILAQTFKDYELIIVDDGSTDNTKEIVARYLTDSRVTYIYQENKERGAARNRGAQEAKGTYLLFFDSDDLALPDHLEKAHDLIMKHGVDKVLWMHGNYSSLFKGNILHIQNKPVSGWITKKLMHGNVIWICTSFIRKDFYETLRFDEDRELSSSEDWEFAIRASVKAPIYCQPSPTFLLRQHPGRSMSFPEMAERSKLSVLNKMFLDVKINHSIKKYKNTAYGYGYLYIAIAYFSKNNLSHARSFLKKAFLVNPLMTVKPKFIKWLIRLYLLPFSNFNKRFNKVLYLTYNGLCQPLGQSQVIPYLIGLTKEGYKFTVLSFEHHYEKDFEREYQKVKAELDKAGIGWIALKYHKHPRFISSIYDILHGIIKAILFYFKEPYYIVHARSYVPAMIGLILKKIFKTKLIFDMRGMMANEKVDAEQWQYSSFGYKITQYVERLMLKNADAIVVLTEKIKTYLRLFTYVKAPITVIPTCVDTKRFPPRAQTERGKLRKELGLLNRLVIVYSGSLGTWYMFKEMVELFKAIKPMQPDAFFLILNKNEHQYAKQVLESSGVEASDYLIKAVSPDTVHAYLWASDIGIFFYKSTFSRIATYPTKLAEYLACGLPVIGNAGVGDVEEILGRTDTGVIVHTFNNNDFRHVFEQAIALIHDPDFKQRSYSIVKDTMSVEVGVKKYKDIYEYESSK